jgi:hypothetical protein
MEPAFRASSSMLASAPGQASHALCLPQQRRPGCLPATCRHLAPPPLRSQLLLHPLHCSYARPSAVSYDVQCTAHAHGHQQPGSAPGPAMPPTRKGGVPLLMSPMPARSKVSLSKLNTLMRLRTPGRLGVCMREYTCGRGQLRSSWCGVAGRQRPAEAAHDMLLATGACCCYALLAAVCLLQLRSAEVQKCRSAGNTIAASSGYPGGSAGGQAQQGALSWPGALHPPVPCRPAPP